VSIGDAIREEAKRRHAAGETKSLSQLGIWLKAADFADSQPNGTDITDDVELMAEALRAYNVRHHDAPSWEEADAHARSIWIRRAEDHLAELAKAKHRRDRIIGNPD